MAILHIFSDRVFQHEKLLFKSLTTIGSDAHTDLQIEDPSIPSVAAHINHQGQLFTLIATDPKFPIRVNNKKISKHVLKDNDSFQVGKNKYVFLKDFAKNSVEKKNLNSSPEIEAYKRLLQFSHQIANETEIVKLLNILIDEIIDITKAEKGFLILYENNLSTVKIARNIDGQSLNKTIDDLSDSILTKVINSKKALVVSDANSDQEFKSSESVINFKLSSVMCVPLLKQGELFGAIYVGNNSFANAFDETSLEILTIFASQASLLVQNALNINALSEQTNSLKASLEYTKFGGIIGSCSHMQQVFNQIDKIACTEASVLITGETGTGKELVAREIHRRSGRASGPFVVFNCGAVDASLLESELFGHVRGAFPGAHSSRIGRFQTADHGTLFLDEVGALPTRLQVNILSTIQNRRVVRLGENRSEEIDIRIISATNLDLTSLVKSKTFREDLFYKLSPVQIEVPALKNRGNDVLVISNYFLQKYAKIYNKKIDCFSQEAQNAILNYAWPGNVRQLENSVRRAIIMSEKNYVQPKDLNIVNPKTAHVLPLSEAVEHFRQQYISNSLERNAGNRTQTAKELGVDPRTIFRHLEDKKKEVETYV